MNKGLVGYPATAPVAYSGVLAHRAPGRWSSLWPVSGATSSSSFSNDYIVFYPFVAMGKIVETAIECTSLVASNVMTIAIFRDRNLLPAERAAVLLTADMSSTGVKQAPSVFDFGNVPSLWWYSFLQTGGASAASFRNVYPNPIRPFDTSNTAQGLLDTSNLQRVGIGAYPGTPTTDSYVGKTLIAQNSSANGMPMTVVRWAP